MIMSVEGFTGTNRCTLAGASFEKMLYDQALLVPVYLEAYLYSQNTRYREVVEETLDYVIEYLRHEDGGSTRQKMRIVKVLKVPFISGVHPILTTY